MDNKFIKKEEGILNFWEDNKIFKKSVGNKSLKGDYVFYDGPPFATGLPHYGHIVASLMKDVVPRYWTMKGYKVERRWGWDCHGLPIENIAESELGIKYKDDIEKKGIKNFNEYCRGLVLRYANEWKDIIKRVGRWAEMENDYKTMDIDFMESIWWGFKALYDKDLVYKGYKSMHICPRCGTTLSNFEVSQNYQDIKDLSVIAKFELTEEHGTYILAWTTTPWTLPGNVALAMGHNIKYVKFSIKNHPQFPDGTYIAAEKFFLDKINSSALKQDANNFNLDASEIKPNDLIGKKYKPLFNYFLNEDLENKENIYTIQTADFVSVEDGTGVVHIAPAFGEDDMNLGRGKKLPMIQHVKPNGRFVEEVKEWAGELVKPKGDSLAVDRKIVEYLDKKNLMFKAEEFIHSYPLCWRCDTPLLNYATSSWFVNVTEIRDKMLINNAKIRWVPDHIKGGRFGKWLENVKDWAISRERYWGTPIPVWECERCGERRIIESVDELEKEALNGRKFYVMRHGEADNNVLHTFNSLKDDGIKLTEKGINEVNDVIKNIRDKKINLIISSDIDRAVWTAEIISKETGIEIIYEQRLREVDVGDWNKELVANHKDFREEWKQGKNVKYPNGEGWLDVKKRVEDFYNDLLQTYRDCNVLIITHGDLLVAFEAILSREKEFLSEIKYNFQHYCKNTEIREYSYKVIDLHKHNIDYLTLKCPKCEGEMKRIKEIFDCWFESGSMFYAQQHYPFENKKRFEKNFPAQFIAEGIDQTRGWFYTLLVLSTALFNEPAAFNVIVNGIVLAEDGQKMSKRKKNYPDPMEIVGKYGVDSLRYYLLSSPVMLAENLNFSEKGVKEAFQKTVMLLDNILSFYKMYEDKSLLLEKVESGNILDKWILTRLNQLINDVDRGMGKYNLPDAVRPIDIFINDLSTWYLRRSRDRFKGENLEDKKAGLQTMRFVLMELSKIMAPFMPFTAESLYKDLSGDLKSVHLEKFPQAGHIEEDILSKMNIIRKVVEMGQSLRAQAGIKIRQVLANLEIKGFANIEEDYLDLIKDELNIKKINAVDSFSNSSDFISAAEGNLAINLNTELTPELKQEGFVRELVRQINALRKENNLTINDRIKIYFQTESSNLRGIIMKMKEQIKKETLSDEILDEVIEGMKEVKVDSEAVKLGIIKFV